MKTFDEKVKIATKGIEVSNVWMSVSSLDKRSSIFKIRETIFKTAISEANSKVEKLNVLLAIEKKRVQGWKIDISSDGRWFNAWKDGGHTGGKMILPTINDL